MALVTLLLGTNLGNKKENLCDAINYIEKLSTTLVSKSSIYKTPPWGYESNNVFFNQVIIIETEIFPFTLLKEIQNIEQTLGRNKQRDKGYQDRLIDIDILFYDDLLIQSETLIVPHPHISSRRFTLVPLIEVNPYYIHPKLNTSIKELLTNCKDEGIVEMVH